MRNDETAALSAASAMFTEETEEAVVEQETPEEAVAPQETEAVEVPFPDFEITLPEDLEEELSIPTEYEIQQELENDEEYQNLDEYGRRLLARARQAERELQHARDQRVKTDKAKWVEEAKKFMPLSAPFLDGINADSRRGFLREAKRYHEAVLPMVKPITDQAKATIEAEKTKARDEARAEAEKRWGSPVEQRQPTEATISQEQITRNRAKGDLSSTIRAMIFPVKKET